MSDVPIPGRAARVFGALGIRARVSLLLLVATVPFVALLLAKSVDQYELLKQRERVRVLQLARLAAHNQNLVVEQTRQLLYTLATISSIQARDWAACQPELERFLEPFRGSYSNFVVADLQGDIVCSGVPLRGRVNISDIRDFREVIATRRFVVGDLVLARTTNTWVVLHRAPVLGSGGELIATVSAPVPVERFAAAAAAVTLPQDGELLIIDNGGRLVAYRPGGLPTGQEYGHHPLVRALLHRDDGVAEFAGLDGVPRVYGFATAQQGDGAGIHVAIGVPLESLAGALNRELLADLAVVAATLLGVLALAFYGFDRLVSGKLGAILATASRIRAGDSAARTGLRGGREELNQIGEALDEMASALQSREVQLQEALRESHELAITDPLTGLHNRRYLWDLLGRELMKAGRAGKPVAAILLDIDHFKRFNDAWGHEGGDLVLQRVADIIRDHVRGSDIACRYGGEELVVVLPEAQLDVATHRAEAIRRGIAAERLERDGTLLDTITASFGVAVFPLHAGNAESLLRAADEALYEAKRAGRNRVVSASRIAAVAPGPHH